VCRFPSAVDNGVCSLGARGCVTVGQNSVSIAATTMWHMDMACCCLIMDGRGGNCKVVAATVRVFWPSLLTNRSRDCTGLDPAFCHPIVISNKFWAAYNFVINTYIEYYHALQVPLSTASLSLFFFFCIRSSLSVLSLLFFSFLNSSCCFCWLDRVVTPSTGKWVQSVQTVKMGMT